MEAVRETLQKQKSETYGHMSYVVNSVNPYVPKHMNNNEYKHNEYDEVVDKYKHLRESDEYRKLHIFHARRIGVQKYMQLAAVAEQEGRNPARYFTWLLKNEE